MPVNEDLATDIGQNFIGVKKSKRNGQNLRALAKPGRIMVSEWAKLLNHDIPPKFRCKSPRDATKIKETARSTGSDLARLSDNPSDQWLQKRFMASS